MTGDETLGYDDPCFVISVAARILGVQTQTLRYYERVGIIMPSRTGGRQRVYSRRDVDRIRRIRKYMDDWGVNLAGAEVLIRLMDRVQESEVEIQRLKSENQRLKELLTDYV
jgi:MerR family transcriptional regulator/heat shock protein HspR